MSLFVDRSVWSLALRRDATSSQPEVAALRVALEGGEALLTTGLVLQELLQGFAGPRARKELSNGSRRCHYCRLIVTIISLPRNCGTVVAGPVCNLARSTPFSRSSASATNSRCSRPTTTSSGRRCIARCRSGPRRASHRYCEECAIIRRTCLLILAFYIIPIIRSRRIVRG